MKRKKKKRRVTPLFIILLIIIGFGGYFVNKEYQYRQSNEYLLLQKNYTKEEILLLQNNLSKTELNKLTNEEKNEQLLTLIAHKDFKKDNLNRYLEYKGPKTIDEIIYLVNKDIDKLGIAYDENITKITKSKYYLQERLERYLNYKKTYPKLTTEDIVTNVNSNLDYDYYTNTNHTDMSKGNLIIVNKFYYLDKDYVASDLVSLNGTYHKATKETALHFNEMIEAAKREHGYTFKINSAYRSYDLQSSLYNRYKSQHGFAWAEKFSARPGFSEHQTGLAIDMVANSSSFETFENTKEYEWMINNAHKYGFILRYPKGKEHITGYEYEPWHYRYVGVEVATKIYNEKLTYEEYYAYYVK